MKLLHREDQFLRLQNISEFPLVCFQRALGLFQDLSVQWLGIQQLACMKDRLSEPSDMTTPKKN